MSVHFASSKWKKAWTKDEAYWNIFVGDLGPDVDDQMLWNEFSQFASLLYIFLKKFFFVRPSESWIEKHV